MAFLRAGVILLVLYWLYNVFKITRNYFKVRKCGFPIIITPVDQTDPFWIILSTFLLPTCEKILPTAIWRSLDLSTYGFEWRDFVAGRSRPSNYFLVGPGRLDLFITDPAISNTVLTKRKQFLQDEIVVKIMGALGPNLVASEGEDWQRQRRLIAPMLNERIMDTVWAESQRQAGDMLDSFMTDGGTTTGTIEGLRKIAFNLLQCVGYGHPQPWGEKAGDALPGRHMPYMEALHELIDGFLVIAFVPSKVLKLPFMPSAVKRKGHALQDFLIYTQEMLEKERDTDTSAEKPRNNLLSLLSTISQKTAKGVLLGVPSAESQSLSDNEVTGNLYQFTLAGFDTTANTLAYAVAMLAANPKWQDWIIEEIHSVQQEVGGQAGYTQIFPRLERCLALMYETLRMFTPVSHIVRECAYDQTVRSSDKIYQIPAGTRVTCVLQGVHQQQDSWGEDQADFRPTRWIGPTSSVTIPIPNSVPQAPNLQPPTKGAFLPWSVGPRICPGMKMAQVEFLSVIWTLFREYRVEAAHVGNESKEDAELRLGNVILDSEPRITLQMRKPRDAFMTWRKMDRA